MKLASVNLQLLVEDDFDGDIIDVLSEFIEYKKNNKIKPVEFKLSSESQSTCNMLAESTYQALQIANFNNGCRSTYLVDIYSQSDDGKWVSSKET